MHIGSSAEEDYGAPPKGAAGNILEIKVSSPMGPRAVSLPPPVREAAPTTPKMMNKRGAIEVD